jgi:type IV pilus assembly protein PilO
MQLRFDVEEKLEQLAKVPRAARLGAVGAVMVAMAAGYYFLSYQDAQAQLSRSRAQAQELQRKLNKVRAVANNLSEFEQEVADLQRQLEDALKQLPNRKQFEDLLQDVSTVGKKVGVQIKSIQRQPEVLHDFYAEVPFMLEIEGSYHDIALFFDRVSKLPRIVNVGSLKVAVASEDSSRTLLRVEGTASTFRFLGEESEETAQTPPDGRGRA